MDLSGNSNYKKENKILNNVNENSQSSYHNLSAKEN